jgi:GNAT superfamily N-acetyltransferase
MPLELRHAGIDDASDLVRLVLELGYDADDGSMRRRLGRVLALGDHVVFVATESPHGLVGCIHIAVSVTLLARPFAEIHALVVSGAHRRQGVGQALLQRAQRWATGRGLLDLVAQAQVHRKMAGEFYRALGFRPLKDQRVFIRELDAPHPVEHPTAMD